MPACVSPTVAGAVHNIVTDYGATPHFQNELDDDTDAIQQALSCAKPGDTVLVPAGLFHVEDTLTADSPITLQGERLRSGIFLNRVDRDLVRFHATSDVVVKDLFLSGLSSSANTALLHFDNVDRPTVDNLYLFGGNSGLAIENSRSGVFRQVQGRQNHFWDLPACGYLANPVKNCNSQQWILIDDTSSLTPPGTSSAHQFINPLLEGQIAGIVHTGGQNSAGWSVVGGVISVAGGTDGTRSAIDIKNTKQPILIKGMHIEANNVLIDSANAVSIESTMVSGALGQYRGRVCITGETTGLRLVDNMFEALDITYNESDPAGGLLPVDMKNNRFGTGGTCAFSDPVIERRCRNYRSSASDAILNGCH